jgi:GntR family transcriptional regulator, transcriptional repressor for pyruvate dehydrogenase complex
MATATVAGRDGPVQALRLHEQVVRQLVRQIVDGTYPPGTALPTEPELVQRFGVSRTVVREAVRILVAKGLVAVRHGSGMWVAPPDRWDQLDPMIISEQVRAGGDGPLLDEMIEMRRLLEMEIAALAATRRTEADLEALRGALEGMRRARTDPEAYTRLDVEFHDAILAAARNRLLREALRSVAGVLGAGRRIAVYRPSVIERSLPSHEAIYGAIAAGDPGAAREAMRRHIAEFEQDIRTAIASL